MPCHKFVVIEGIDRSGKTTITKHIASHMHNTTRITFPNRQSITGQIIDSYLKNSIQLNAQAIHLLFSANRWEMKHKIDELLQTKHIVCDRYYYSGIAYSVANGLDIDWCSKPDTGLRKPDIVIFLDVKPSAVQQRSGFGNEKYEKIEYLDNAYTNLKAIVQNEANGHVVDANCSLDELTQKVVRLIEKHTDTQE